MIERAPSDVTAYDTDGRPTGAADAVLARRADGWGLARRANTLRIVAPPDGPEPWFAGPDAPVELRRSGDGRWYPIDRRGESSRKGFADPWRALAAVRRRLTGPGRAEALRRLDDRALVALRFGQRVVLWPAHDCAACHGSGMASDATGTQCARATNRYWLDGPGAPPGLLTPAQAASAVDVIIDETTAAAEADRAAWGLDMQNRGEPTAPTVRQREVLSRVGEQFTLADLQESACHRYAGHTRRMASEMEARGAIEPLGDGRYRKTPLAIPVCAREPAEPPSKERKGSKGEQGKKGRKASKPTGRKASTPSPKPAPKPEPAARSTKASPRSPKPAPKPEPAARSTKASTRSPKPAPAPKPVREPREAPPTQLSGPSAESEAPRRAERRPVPFKAFTYEFDGRDDQKVHVSPDRRTVVLRSDHAWWVLHRTTDRIWQLVAGPLKFTAARRAAVEVASQPPDPIPVGPLSPTPAVELTDEGRDAISVVDVILGRLRAVAEKGDRVDLGPLAMAPFIARLSGLEERDARFWWTRVASWTIENDRRGVTALEVARAVGLHRSAHFEPPQTERADAFDLEWLKYRLRAHGCAKLHRLTGTYFATFCAADGTERGVSIRQRPDGWIWARHKDADATEHGPFTRASALLDDVIARLGLARDAGRDQLSGPGPRDPLRLAAQPMGIRELVDALPMSLATRPPTKRSTRSRLEPMRARAGRCSNAGRRRLVLPLASNTRPNRAWSALPARRTSPGPRLRVRPRSAGPGSAARAAGRGRRAGCRGGRRDRRRADRAGCRGSPRARVGSSAGCRRVDRSLRPSARAGPVGGTRARR